MNEKLSILKEVDLREVWANEAINFTPWLAKQENLDILGEEIGGLNIELIESEASVGKYNVDILAKDNIGDRKIIIENQLENTNHRHLGQIITYASGHDAKIIIWIVKGFNSEHQQAVKWLNEHTDQEIGFFLVKLKVYRIENSPPAPKFEIVASPNEWAKTIKISSYTSNELTNTQEKQLFFWQEFTNYIHENGDKIQVSTPIPKHFCSSGIGFSGCVMFATILFKEKKLGCVLYFSKDKLNFLKYLYSIRDKIEKEIDQEVNWELNDDSSNIKTYKEVTDVFDQSKYKEYFDWLYKKIAIYKEVLPKYWQEYK